MNGHSKCNFFCSKLEPGENAKRKPNANLFNQVWSSQHLSVRYWAACILYNDLFLSNFSGNTIFWMPLIVLRSATEPNIELELKPGVCWNLPRWLTFSKEKSLTVIVTNRKKWSQKDIKCRIYGLYIFEWRAAKPCEVSLGSARFCFLCLALLVFFPVASECLHFPFLYFHWHLKSTVLCWMCSFNSELFNTDMPTPIH